MTNKKLTAKQEAFINHYLETWNATEAARRAKYKGNDDTLGSVASENLQKPKIQERIQERMRQLQKNADEVLLRLAQQAESSIGDFIDDAGVINWRKVRAKGHLVKKIAHRRGSHASIELQNQQRALELLGKHLGVFIDKQEIEHKHKGDVTIRIVRDGDSDTSSG